MRRGFCLHRGLRGRRAVWVYPMSSLGLKSEKGRSVCVLEGCMDLDVIDNVLLLEWPHRENSLPPQRLSFAL